MPVRHVEELEARYGVPNEASTVKVLDHLSDEYRRYVEASPFVLLATVGPEGLDCSPRGDRGAAVHVEDPRTLILPDRRGNNRIDSLRNIVRDPRVALLFLVPGLDTTLRVNGHAEVEVEPHLLARFTVEGKEPRSVVVLHIEEVYFQCARALVRAELWERRVDPSTLPTAGEMLAACSAGTVGGEAYDREWPERARKTLW
jgi:uncharacterized protein